MIEKRKIFITVKTYPALSKKYDEIVCTAGILDDGSWARIYPLPFRKLDYEKRYRKYQWLEIQLQKNTSDPRPESYKVCDITQVRLIGEPVGTAMGWKERKRIIFDGMLYWNCLQNSSGDEQEAVYKVKEKYFNLFSQKDIYLFLGTTKQFHGWAKNPFVIIGVFYPPLEPQLSFS
jgi:hypothetical protein